LINTGNLLYCPDLIFTGFATDAVLTFDDISISLMPNKKNFPGLEADRILLEAAVREAGALALGYYFAGSRSWRKADKSPVSEADLSVDRLLRQRLTSRRAHYGWLSEETADTRDRLERSHVWIVDPIDGTRAFLNAAPWWSVSAALVIDGEPVLGAVFAPALNAYFEATSGGGATLNAAPIHTSACTRIRNCRILAGQYAFRAKDWPQINIEQRNSVAYRLALVASGAFDAAFTAGQKSEWDMAAGDLLLREAGGLLTGIDGAPFTYNAANTRRNGLLAASSAFHKQFLARVRELS